MTGLSMFVGLWNIGTGLLYFLRLRVPSPWNHVTSVLLGIQALSLTVQTIGIAGLSSRPLLSTIGWALVGIGALTPLIQNCTLLTVRSVTLDRWALLPIAI